VGHPTFYANHQVNLLNSDHNNDTFLYNFIFYTCIELILSYYLLEESVTFEILIFSKVFSALIVGTCFELGIKLAGKYSQASGLYLGSN